MNTKSSSAAAGRIENPVDISKNSFDYIRIFCTYIVFFGHFLTHFEVESSALFFIAYIVRAVPVFFLFSGFFTAASLERYSTKEFYIRRFFRIYPAMWICIILNTVIIMFLYSGFPSLKDFVIYAGSQLTVGQFYTGDWLRGYGVGVPNGALWTISSDIQFYIIAVLIARLMKKRSLKVWIAVVAAFAMLSLVLQYLSPYMPETLFKLIMVVIIPFMYIFLFGMMVYYHREKLVPFFKKYVFLFGAVYLVWSLLPDGITKYFEGVRYNVVTTILLMCLVISLGFALGSHRMKTDYTYGFYLYHMVVINVVYHVFVKKIESPLLFIGLLVLTSVIIFGLGFLSTQIVDKKIANPLMKKTLSRFVKKEEAAQ